MPNTFTEVSEECAREGKIGRFLDMANPALYIRWASFFWFMIHSNMIVKVGFYVSSWRQEAEE